MPNIELIQRDKDDLLEKMLGEISFMKSAIDDYKKLIRKEWEDGNDVIHRRDSFEWVNTHYERFNEARTELLEKKAYLLAYSDMNNNQK